MRSKLRRDLNLFAAIGVGLGAIIGAGVFVVTGVAAGVAGAAFIFGLLLAGLVATFNALSSAQLAATYPQSGGTYEYGYQVLHPWLGFTAGWMFLASKMAAGGTVALGFAGYLSALVPGIPQRPIAIAAVLLLALINYFGIQKTGWLNTFIVSISLLSLIIFVLAGLPTIDLNNFLPFAPTGFTGILHSTALLFFAYTGYARLATLGEEVRVRGRVAHLGRAEVQSLLGLGVVAHRHAAFLTRQQRHAERDGDRFVVGGIPGDGGRRFHGRNIEIDSVELQLRQRPGDGGEGDGRDACHGAGREIGRHVDLHVGDIHVARRRVLAGHAVA